MIDFFVVLSVSFIGIYVGGIVALCYWVANEHNAETSIETVEQEQEQRPLLADRLMPKPSAHVCINSGRDMLRSRPVAKEQENGDHSDWEEDDDDILSLPSSS